MEAKADGSGEAGHVHGQDKAATDPAQTKLVRLLTVIAYVCSVSMAAVMLSLYYVFLWDPHRDGSPAPFKQPDEAFTTASDSKLDISVATSTNPFIRQLIADFTGTFPLYNYIDLFFSWFISFPTVSAS